MRVMAINVETARQRVPERLRPIEGQQTDGQIDAQTYRQSDRQYKQ